ncbi:MAG: hypothetical protein R2698_00890 [Microthrixaceae bacterium]
MSSPTPVAGAGGRAAQGTLVVVVLELVVVVLELVVVVLELVVVVLELVVVVLEGSPMPGSGVQPTMAKPSDAETAHSLRIFPSTISIASDPRR